MPLDNAATVAVVTAAAAAHPPTISLARHLHFCLHILSHATACL